MTMLVVLEAKSLAPTFGRQDSISKHSAVHQHGV